MDERHFFRSNETLEEFLGNPFLILAYEIFRQALADCKNWTYHDELKQFAASDWCLILLMDSMTQEEVIERFDREMKEAPKKHRNKHYGFCNKSVEVNNERLADARRKAKLTQREAAAAVNVKMGRIVCYERRGTLIPKKILKALCELYGCSEDYIKESKHG